MAALSAAPRLATARVVLRAHAASDLPALAAMWADPEVTRFIGGRPFTAEESWSRLLRHAGHWALSGWGYWVVETPDGRFVGEAGLADWRRDMTPRLHGVPEAGWALARAWWGAGLAREAMAAVLAWADAEGVAARSFCMIEPEHAASLRVARGLGYSDGVPGMYREKAVLVLTRDVSGATTDGEGPFRTQMGCGPQAYMRGQSAGRGAGGASAASRRHA